MFLKGNRFWPAVFIGAFLTHLTTVSSLLPVLLISIGNTLEALCGAFILQLILSNKQRFGLHSKTIAIILASFLSSLISATIGVLALSIYNISAWEIFGRAWLTWWTGDVLGGIVILPVVLALFKNNFIESTRPALRWRFVGFLFLSCLVLCYFLFIRPGGATFLFFIFPLLLWSVYALGARLFFVMTALISFISILSVVLGVGVFAHVSNKDILTNIQLFLGSVSICSMIMSDLKRILALRQYVFILMLSWFLTGIFLFGFYARTLNESEKHFEAIIDGIEPMFDERIQHYLSLLQSGKALFAASKNVTKTEWKTFLQSIQSQQALPGVAGVGVIFRVTKKHLNDFILQMQKNEIKNFDYQLFPDGESFSRKFDEAYVVTYVEPLWGNKNRVGMDMASEPIRKSATDLARDTGEPTLSGKIELIEGRSGFLALYPFYKNTKVPDSIEARRANLIGWFYSPIYSREFFDSVFSLGSFKGISFAVFENINNESVLITSSFDYFELPKSAISSRVIKIGNRNYLFRFKRKASFYTSLDNFASWAGAASSILSLLLGTFIISLQSVKKRALDLANKKTEDLKANEELWKYALEGAGDVVWDYYIAENVIKFNNDLNATLGYGDEFSESSDYWKSLVHPEDLPRLNLLLQMHFEDNATFNGEYRLLCKNGGYKWFQTRGRVVRWDKDKNPIRMVGTVTDISSRKAAEHELASQKEKLNSIFEGSSDAVLLLTSDGHFFDCNSQALKLFGFESKIDLCTRRPFELSPPIQHDGMDSETKAAQVTAKALRDGINRFEWICMRQNGESFPVEILMTSFTYDEQKAFLVCVRDITDRKLTEAALSAQREKLLAAAKMSSLGEMAGGIAHEINNPLAIILAKTTQVKRRMRLNEEIGVSISKNAEALIDSLTTIEATTKRIGAIIKGLSAFSRNAENDSTEKILVSILIQDTLELSKERFQFHSIALKFDLSACEKTYINGRAAQLLQVLINLLNNAYDAVESMPEKWVQINTEVTKDICRIIVTDSGPGIPPELIDKIMAPFFSTKSIGKGTGLGLSISKGIIEEHKGKFYVDEDCKNTRFVVELPVA